MKTLSYYIVIGFISISVFACRNSNKQTDSVKSADKTNDSTFRNDANGEFLDDADFVVMAFNNGLTEIELGSIAEKNGLDQEIKDLGKVSVDDFSKMNKAIQDLSAKKDITLPEVPDKKSENEIQNFKDKSGNIFDREYVEKMIEDHAKEIRSFENAEKNANDLDIRAFASETLPMLRKHLESAEELKLRIPFY